RIPRWRRRLHELVNRPQRLEVLVATFASHQSTVRSSALNLAIWRAEKGGTRCQVACEPRLCLVLGMGLALKIGHRHLGMVQATLRLIPPLLRFTRSI